MNNIEIEMDKILDSESEFIETLCEQLEEAGIHLTQDLLVKILSTYEEQKISLLKDVLDQVLAQDGVDLGEPGGPSILQVVLDGKRVKEEETEVTFKVDSKYIV